jgi:5-methylcytosine-specific restriction endonuclease McrA
MINRKLVFNKYNGHCAYCGIELTIKSMQVDHFLPKTSECFIDTCKSDPGKFDNFIKAYMHNHTCYIGHIKKLSNINDITNLMPSCRRCNHYKRSSTIEQYRTQLLTITDRLSNDYLFKVAVDYGIVTITKWDGKFYYEKEGL